MKLTELIRRAIAIAEPTGTITFDQLNDLAPHPTKSSRKTSKPFSPH
jgi:hypothetical protein